MLCPSCFAEVPAGAGVCPRCAVRVVGVPCEAGRAGAAGAGARPASPNPWEVRGGRGALEAFGATLQQSLFHPAAFFRGTSPGGSPAAALGYAALVGGAGLLVMGLWQLAVAGRGVDGGGGLPARGALLLALPLLPAWVTVSNLVAAGVLHLSLSVLRGARGGYGTTLKAVCYANSGMALCAVPGIGLAIGVLWQAAVTVIGLRELHGLCCTSRAVLAFLLPVLAAGALVGLAALAAALAGIGAFMHLLESGARI